MSNKPLLYSSEKKRHNVYHHHYYHSKAERDEKNARDSFVIKFFFKWAIPIIWILLNITLTSGVDDNYLKGIKSSPFFFLIPIGWLGFSVYLTYLKLRR